MHNQSKQCDLSAPELSQYYSMCCQIIVKVVEYNIGLGGSGTTDADAYGSSSINRLNDFRLIICSIRLWKYLACRTRTRQIKCHTVGASSNKTKSFWLWNSADIRLNGARFWYFHKGRDNQDNGCINSNSLGQHRQLEDFEGFLLFSNNA